MKLLTRQARFIQFLGRQIWAQLAPGVPLLRPDIQKVQKKTQKVKVFLHFLKFFVLFFGALLCIFGYRKTPGTGSRSCSVHRVLVESQRNINSTELFKFLPCFSTGPAKSFTAPAHRRGVCVLSSKYFISINIE